MIFQLITPEGVIKKEEIEYVVIQNEEGQRAILNQHVPIILWVKKGHVKVVDEDRLFYAYIEEGVIDFKEQILSVLAVEAFIGDTLEEALKGFDHDRAQKIEESKKANIDFSKQERELRESISRSKAGHR